MPEYRTDYTKYSLAELREALAGVDGDLYPDNKAALEAELQRRKDSGEYDRELDRQAADLANREADKRKLALKLRPWLAYYLIGTAPLVWLLGAEWVVGLGGVRATATPIVLLFAAASMTAGAGLLRSQPWGYWLALTVFGLQVVQLQIAGFVFVLNSALRVYVGVDSNAVIGAGGSFSPGVHVLTGVMTPAWAISVNLFAIACIWVLAKAREADGEAPNDAGA